MYYFQFYKGRKYCCRSPPPCFSFLSNYEGQGEERMKNKYRVLDSRNMYPEVNEEVIEVLRQTERKMQYQQHDLKAENYEIYQKEEKVIRISSREDSLDLLLDLERQFTKEQPSVEEEAIRAVMFEELHHAIQMLTKEEQELVELLYFDEKSERDNGGHAMTTCRQARAVC